MNDLKLPDDVQLEINAAQEAMRDGNHGKARVCARRAIARAFEKSNLNTNPDRPLSAMEILHRLSEIENIPSTIKSAIKRLSTSVADHDMEISTMPVDDALEIITFIMQENRLRF